jgi:hypothetical protein
MQLPAHAPFEQTAGHACVVCQVPVESQVWASCPLHCVALGMQLPVHAPFAQTNGQMPESPQEPAVHVCTLEPEHRVVFGEHPAPPSASPPLAKPLPEAPPLAVPLLFPEPVPELPLEVPVETPDAAPTGLPIVAVPHPERNQAKSDTHPDTWIFMMSSMVEVQFVRVPRGRAG